MLRYVFTFTAILLFLNHNISSAEDRCRSVSFDHLYESKSEANTCLDCEKKDQILPGFNLSVPANSCFQTSVKHKLKKHRLCEQGHPPLEKSTKPICANDSYVSTTAQTFHDVTNCLGIKNPDYLFALFNTESRFQITAMSETGASCYGQLTGIAIADVNQWLPVSVDKESPSCKRILHYWKKLDTATQTYPYKKTEQTLCTAYSNPYSCMFYSTLYYKKGLDVAEKALDDLDLVSVKVKGEDEIYLYKDKEEYKKRFPEKLKHRIESVKHISLFESKKDIAYMTALASYNGGYGSVSNLLKDYTNDLKSQIWNNKHNLRKDVFAKKPVGISSAAFLKTFSGYTLKNYGAKRGRRQEVGGYIEKVFKDYSEMFSSQNCGNLAAKQILKTKSEINARF